MNQLGQDLMKIAESNPYSRTVIVEGLYIFSDDWEPCEVEVFLLEGVATRGRRIFRYNPLIKGDPINKCTPDELEKLIKVAHKYSKGEGYASLPKATNAPRVKVDHNAQMRAWIAKVQSELN